MFVLYNDKQLRKSLFALHVRAKIEGCQYFLGTGRSWRFKGKSSFTVSSCFTDDNWSRTRAAIPTNASLTSFTLIFWIDLINTTKHFVITEALQANEIVALTLHIIVLI
jgi:hypothetical protein